MDAIRYAINTVKQRVPRAILEQAFVGSVQNWRRPAEMGLDSQIHNLVIRPRVLEDCNIVGGVEVVIDLTGLSPLWSDDRTRVYRIPKDRTQGRSIVSALSVNYYPSANLTSGMLAQSIGGSRVIDRADATSLMGAAGAVMASADRLPITGSATTRLVGENTIMINDTYMVGRDYSVRVCLTNEENLNNINPRSYMDFAKLVEYAVKSFIYNELIVTMGQAHLQGGQELGVFKTIVEGYADAQENYETFLTESWQPVAFMNDQETYHRHIHSLIGGMR